jgi:hypothetical protein
MHVMAFHKQLAQRPELPKALFDFFEQARRQALQGWADPKWSMMMWGRRELERQETHGNLDPWRKGLN